MRAEANLILQPKRGEGFQASPRSMGGTIVVSRPITANPAPIVARPLKERHHSCCPNGEGDLRPSAHFQAANMRSVRGSLDTCRKSLADMMYKA
jgi:hypothetical protein